MIPMVKTTTIHSYCLWHILYKLSGVYSTLWHTDILSLMCWCCWRNGQQSLLAATPWQWGVSVMAICLLQSLDQCHLWGCPLPAKSLLIEYMTMKAGNNRYFYLALSMFWSRNITSFTQDALQYWVLYIVMQPLSA